MKRILPWVRIVLVSLVLGGCATAPGIPDTVYFRLPARAAAEALPQPLFAEPIVVETLLADGLHSDQAIIYSLDPDGARLKAYHYQLWVDPPVRMLQRRLIVTLREAGVSRIVADRLANQVEAVRIQGRLERFERVRTGSGWKVSVGMSLRADLRDGKPPLVMHEYRLELPTDDDTLPASVRAFGSAIDRLYADFIHDLGAARADG